MMVKKLTPNLYTDDVESCVKFWVERMHFEKICGSAGRREGSAFAALHEREALN